MKLSLESMALRKDARGWVVEPLDIDGLAAQQNVHVVSTLPGGVRGNHYHLQGTEIMVVPGPALVRVREDGVISDIVIPDGEVFRFTIPPLISHAIRNTGDRPAVMVAFNTLPHDPANPDVRHDPLI